MNITTCLSLPQIDIDPMRIGMRYPIEVGLVGDSRRTLQGLLPLLNRNEDRSFLEQAIASMKDWLQLMEERRCANSFRQVVMDVNQPGYQLKDRLENKF